MGGKMVEEMEKLNGGMTRGKVDRKVVTMKRDKENKNDKEVEG